VDPATISALLISVASLVGWMVTQTQARNKAQRAELRARRKHSLLADQYMFRLESALAQRDIPFPAKPEGLDPEEGEDW
jgi:hypothetical protein